MARVARSQRAEASLICDAVMGVAGRHTPRGGGWIDGKDAIKEMNRANFGSWREAEWAGYYLKFIVHQAAVTNVISQFTPIVEAKHYLVKSNYLWDVRLMDEDLSSLILADKARTDELVRDHGGIGVVVFQAVYELDTTGAFKKWHENLGGGPSEYTMDRILRGAPPRIRKTGFMITNALALYLTAADIAEAIRNGWMTLVAQNMRNQDGSIRNPKYMLHLDQAPMDQRFLGVRNFNWDPDEFERVFAGVERI